MATKEEEEVAERVQYPLMPGYYNTHYEISAGVNSVVYLATCERMDSVVALKSIDLDRSRPEFEGVVSGANTLCQLSHPNILKAHCHFISPQRGIFWVVMPYMCYGSVKSIISLSFQDGLAEPCIAVVLKEILKALRYLHGEGHIHRDIKPGNILIGSKGMVKLADFGVSASFYRSSSSSSSSGAGAGPSSSSSSVPYWMAPEVNIHSPSTGYSFKSDIWSFGITALELAHGRRPPLSHSHLLPPSNFSKEFKEMVASCVDQDPSKRPTAQELLNHPFFNTCKEGGSSEFLVKNLLKKVPTVFKRYLIATGKIKIPQAATTSNEEVVKDSETTLAELYELKGRLVTELEQAKDMINDMTEGEVQVDDNNEMQEIVMLKNELEAKQNTVLQLEQQLENLKVPASSGVTSEEVRYPSDPAFYTILDKIGAGASGVVHKAFCKSVDNAVLAIKFIDLDPSRTDFVHVISKVNALSLLRHPNVLRAYHYFSIKRRRLWVVMPFMDGGSLQSIIAHSFRGGFEEPFVIAVLKEILEALFFLQERGPRGHVHRDIKPGNILIDSSGRVKLADYGVSASIYESSLTMLNDDVAYWMAPELIHGHKIHWYSVKADIWSFGITALELAYGRPPLSQLPTSNSSMMHKIAQRFGFSDFDKYKKDPRKKFSKEFKDMVASCLDQDPSRRPTAEELLELPFFRDFKQGTESLVNDVLQGLPSVEARYEEASKNKIPHAMPTPSEVDDERKKISGWIFNANELLLNPAIEQGHIKELVHEANNEAEILGQEISKLKNEMKAAKKNNSQLKQHFEDITRRLAQLEDIAETAAVFLTHVND